MADFFKGLAGGFGTGLQFGQAMQQRQERERLREAMGLTPQEMQQRQATPEEFGRAQAETQGLAAQDAAMFGLGPQEQAAYAPQMPVEGQRIGATQYGLGGQTFNRMPTQQEIESARYSAAANVIAERDPVAAMRMRQEQVRMEREAELAPLQKEALQTQVSAGKLGLKKTALELTDAERVAAERENFSGFNAFAAENPNLSVKELKDTAFKQFKFTPKQWQDTVATRLQIETGEMDSFKNSVKKKLQGKNLTQLGSLYNSDPDFDDKTDLAIVPGKGGAVTLNFIDKATKTITGTQTFKNEALATEYLNRQATEPETIGSWIMNLRKTESAIEAQGAATTASNAAANLSNVRSRALKRDAATQAKLDKIEQDFEALTPDEKVGAKGRALVTSYNMASAGPGRQLSLGAAVKPEFNAKDYSATIKNFTDAGFSQTDALIKADQLYGRGPNTAGEDAALAKANAAKGGAPATVTKPSVGLTPQQREQVNLAPQPTRAPTTLDAIQSANLEAVSPLAAQFKQARAQLIQASQSQDPNAIAYYMNQQNALRKQLESEVSRRFGNNAPTVMQQLAGSM